MDAFFKDVQIGNFVASEYNLMPIAFDYNGLDDNDFSMGSETDEEYIGRNTIPLDYGSNHHGKLEFYITFAKNMCSQNTEKTFNNFEIRSILRELTGKQYYRDLYFIDYELHTDERIHYRVKITQTERTRINGNIVALKFTFQCDSFWAYTDEQYIEFLIKDNQTISFYNSSDELNDYLCPQIEITSSSAIDELSIVNKSDNNRTTTIKNINADEIIYLNSKREIISSSNEDRIIVNDFNLKWVKFIPGKNELTFSKGCKIKIKYQLLRKVVF